jgi:hypothetical protein
VTRQPGTCRPSTVLAATAHPPDHPGRYVVLVIDLMTDEADAYGPISRTAAQRYAARVGDDLDKHGIGDVKVLVVALRTALPVTEPGTAASSGREY